MGVVRAMAPPAFDRDDRVRIAHWTPGLHSRCYLMQRSIVRQLLLHCRFRTTGIGVLPPELLFAILAHLEVVVRM